MGVSSAQLPPRECPPAAVAHPLSSTSLLCRLVLLASTSPVPLACSYLAEALWAAEEGGVAPNGCTTVAGESQPAVSAPSPTLCCALLLAALSKAMRKCLAASKGRSPRQDCLLSALLVWLARPGRSSSGLHASIQHYLAAGSLWEVWPGTDGGGSSG